MFLFTIAAIIAVALFSGDEILILVVARSSLSLMLGLLSFVSVFFHLIFSPLGFKSISFLNHFHISSSLHAEDFFWQLVFQYFPPPPIRPHSLIPPKSDPKFLAFCSIFPSRSQKAFVSPGVRPWTPATAPAPAPATAPPTPPGPPQSGPGSPAPIPSSPDCSVVCKAYSTKSCPPSSFFRMLFLTSFLLVPRPHTPIMSSTNFVSTVHFPLSNLRLPLLHLSMGLYGFVALWLFGFESTNRMSQVRSCHPCPFFLSLREKYDSHLSDTQAYTSIITNQFYPAVSQ